MDKEQLKQLLKDNLTIRITEKPEYDYGKNHVTVSILFDGESITQESFTVDMT